MTAMTQRHKFAIRNKLLRNGRIQVIFFDEYMDNRIVKEITPDEFHASQHLYFWLIRASSLTEVSCTSPINIIFDREKTIKPVKILLVPEEITQDEEEEKQLDLTDHTTV